jgi:mannan endo-1,4-beta-mannosidase
MVKWIVMIMMMCSTAWGALVDTSATTETQALYTQLQAAQGNYIYFGQHDFILYTNGSETNTDYTLSESYRICGKLPYLMGVNWQVDEGEFPAIKTNAIKLHVSKGGFIMVCSIPERNLVTDGDSKDKTGDPVVNILPGGTARAKYLAILDCFVNWCNSNKDNNGNLIPIIFRPYHEASGNWFWWGITGCTDAQYISLWQDMVVYLRDTKGLHNLIFCYSPDWSRSQDDRYPGDDYVDIIADDEYPDISGGTDNGTVQDIITNYQAASDFAIARGKLFAIAEGLRKLSTNPLIDYWTTYYLNPILADSKAKKASFIAVWTSPSWGAVYGRSDAYSFCDMTHNSKLYMLDYGTQITNATITNAEIK